MFVIKNVVDMRATRTDQVLWSFETSFGNKQKLREITNGPGSLRFFVVNIVQHENFSCTIVWSRNCVRSNHTHFLVSDHSNLMKWWMQLSDQVSWQLLSVFPGPTYHYNCSVHFIQPFYRKSFEMHAFLLFSHKSIYYKSWSGMAHWQHKYRTKQFWW